MKPQTARALRHVLYVTTERFIDFEKPEGVPVHLMHRQKQLEALGYSRFMGAHAPAATAAQRRSAE